MSNVNVLQTAPKLKMVARKIMQQNRSRSSTSPGKNPLIRELLQRLFYSENKIISCNVLSPSLAQQSSKMLQEFEFYSHLSYSRGGGNKRGWGDLSPNLLHKMNQEGGKIKKINKREGRNFRDEGEKS